MPHKIGTPEEDDKKAKERAKHRQVHSDAVDVIHAKRAKEDSEYNKFRRRNLKAALDRGEITYDEYVKWLDQIG